MLKLKLTTRKAWNILRHLLNENTTKTAQRNQIAKLIHNSKTHPLDLLRALAERYLNTTPPIDPRAYKGAAKSRLDELFTVTETRRALIALSTSTTPGPDGITNKLLRNLDDLSIQQLIQLFNYHWSQGTLPQEWKTAQTALIPKPGKPTDQENLRSISITSCLGKLLEHMVVMSRQYGRFRSPQNRP